MGDGQFFLNLNASLSLMTTYVMSQISAGSISLDNTFNGNKKTKSTWSFLQEVRENFFLFEDIE
jgi:hypothetical protein